MLGWVIKLAANNLWLGAMLAKSTTIVWHTYVQITGDNRTGFYETWYKRIENSVRGWLRAVVCLMAAPDWQWTQT